MKTPSPKKQIKQNEGKSETKAKTPVNPLDFLGGDSVKRSDRTVAAKRTKVSHFYKIFCKTRYLDKHLNLALSFGVNALTF